MNYQDGDIVRQKKTGEVGIVIKRHHPCANFWLVALPSGNGLIHGTDLKPLETK